MLQVIIGALFGVGLFFVLADVYAMWVTVSVRTYVHGLGVFKIPVTVSVTRSGLSEKYWK